MEDNDAVSIDISYKNNALNEHIDMRTGMWRFFYYSMFSQNCTTFFKNGFIN